MSDTTTTAKDPMTPAVCKYKGVRPGRSGHVQLHQRVDTERTEPDEES